jgi:hypothetical protein
MYQTQSANRLVRLIPMVLPVDQSRFPTEETLNAGWVNSPMSRWEKRVSPHRDLANRTYGSIDATVARIEKIIPRWFSRRDIAHHCNLCQCRSINHNVYP